MRTLRAYGLCLWLIPVLVAPLATGCGHEAGFSDLRAWVFWALALALLLCIVLFVILFHILRMQKTQTMALQVKAPVEKAPETPLKRPSAMNDEELFHYLSDLIRDEQLYLNPLLDRQALIDRLGVSAHRIGAAFSKGSEYGSLPGFVRSIRLEHACSLLISRPDMNVKSVGEASGFSNNSTFCSDFKTCYGITPSDYRQENLR